MFSARFHQQDEDDQVPDETNLNINLKPIQNLTQPDIDNIDFKPQLQLKKQKQKIVVGSLIKIISMTIFFYKSSDLNASSYVKVPLGSSAVLKLKMLLIFVSFGQFQFIFFLVK